ncbi:MAG: LytTR family DNA-binding domain-containing protein [Ekhidna sp.]
MKCIIIDDEPLARKLLVDYIVKVPYLELRGAFSSALDALEMINSQHVDLLFLDIQMPDINGVDFLRSLHSKPSVIFTTAHSEYAFDGYQLDVLDYLLKPFNFSTFLRSVEKVKRLNPMSIPAKSEKEQPFIFLKQGNVLVKVQVSDIYYIKGLKDYLRIITKKGQYVVLQTMKSMLEKLSPYHFVRVHNSYMISIRHIESVDSTKVKVGGEPIPIGGMYKKHFHESIKDLLDEGKV